MRSVRTEPLVVISFQLDFKLVGIAWEHNLNMVTISTDIPTDALTSGAVNGQIKSGRGLHGLLEDRRSRRRLTSFVMLGDNEMNTTA